MIYDGVALGIAIQDGHGGVSLITQFRPVCFRLMTTGRNIPYRIPRRSDIAP